jgi:oxygen-independent coproporphyrinogen-3 oxidase
MMNNTLGLYIHVPFCRSKCGYCDFYSLAHAADDRYVNALIQEIKWRSPSFKQRICDTVYFGGGTPSLLSPSQMEKIVGALHEHFHIDDQAEITMEMNPGDMTPEYLHAMHSLGINRISVGVQSHDDRLLKILGRRHTAAEARDAIRRAYREGIENISLDLMYELPGQSVENFEKSLRWAVHLPVNHMSVYSLILEEGTRFGQMASQGKLARPSEEESWAMYQAMCRILPNYGLLRYEISSFARKGYRSRHNMKYWLMDDYLGLGPAACSRLGHKRTENLPGLRQYERELLLGNPPPEEITPLSEAEDMEEYCFMHLRMKEGFSRVLFKERYGEEPEHWYGTQIQSLKEHKLLEEKEGRLYMTPHGAAIGNYVFEQFLRSDEQEEE